MPVSPPLSTTESGTATLVRPTNTLEFNGADFTVTGSGDKATISIDSTGTGAALTDTYIGFGNASNLLTGSADFTFTADTGSAGPIVLLTGNKPIWRLQDDTDATDYKSSFEQSGNSLYLYNGDSAGNNYEMFRFTPSYYWFNRGNEDFDFFFDTGSTEKFFTIDSGVENVGIGGVPDSGVERLHVQTTALSSVLQRWETTAAPTAADFSVKLELETSGTPLVNAAGLGCIDFIGKDSAGNRTNFARMGVVIADKGTATEDGILKFDLIDGGVSQVEHLQMGNGNVVINEDQVNVNFRVEGNSNDSVIRTVANQDNVGMGGVPDSGVERLHVQGTGTGSLVMLESTDDGSSASPDLVFYRNSASPADDNYINQTKYVGRNDNSQDVTYAQTQARIIDATDGTEDGGLYTYMMQAGTLRRVITMTGSGMYINNDGYDFNFAVNDNNDDALLNCDAGFEWSALARGR